MAVLTVTSLAGCEGGQSENQQGDGSKNQPLYDETETQRLYKVGDYYPDPDAVYSNGVLQSGTAAIGIVFWLDTDALRYDVATQSGPSGKIVSLDEASDDLEWGLCDVVTDANSFYDGCANMAAIKRMDNTFSAYPAFAWVDQKNGAAGATAYASGAKGIWYLPAVAELQYLLCAAAGKPYETWSFQDSDNSNCYCPIFNQDEGTIGLSNFNVIISAGGVAFASYVYWSATENGSFNACYVSFRNGLTYYTTNPTSFLVRCVMAF